MDRRINFRNNNNKKYYKKNKNNYFKNPNMRKSNNNIKKSPSKNNYYLNSPWKIYIHNLTEKDWSLDSYKFVYQIETISDFWTFFNQVKDFRKFNYYVMRGDIKPVYEDPENKNGYSYSYIIPGRKVTETFVDVLVKMLSENLVDEYNSYELCGISLTPKIKGISILKIWLKNKDNVLQLNLNNENLMNGRFQLHKFY